MWEKGFRQGFELGYQTCQFDLNQLTQLKSQLKTVSLLLKLVSKKAKECKDQTCLEVTIKIPKRETSLVRLAKFAQKFSRPPTASIKGWVVYTEGRFPTEKIGWWIWQAGKRGFSAPIVIPQDPKVVVWGIFSSESDAKEAQRELSEIGIPTSIAKWEG
jgi:hypothetical protein